MTAIQTRIVTFRSSADTDVREVVFMGQTHTVVPVVAFVGDIVVTALGSTGPELVPAQELERSAWAWNNRPVISIHPTTPDGAPISANTPELLADAAWGVTFNSEFKNNKLLMEAWLSESRALEIGDNAAIEAIAQCKRGGILQISCGQGVRMDQTSGYANNEKYHGVWRNLTPDHLAIGLNGDTGACSIEDGCGTNRSAKGVTSVTSVKENKPDKRVDVTAALSSVGVVLRDGADLGIDGMSHSELREVLTGFLSDMVPGFDGIMDVYDGTVLYYTWKTDEQVRWWSRTYSVSDSGVTLGEDETAVVPTTRFEIVAAVDDTNQKEDAKMAKEETRNGASPEAKELIDKLVACECSQFSESDRSSLELLGVDTLAKFSDRAAAEAAKSTKQAVSAVSDITAVEQKATSKDQHVTLTVQEHARLLAAVTAYESEQKTRKDGLIAAVDANQDTFALDELEGLGVDTLEKLLEVSLTGKDVQSKSPAPANVGFVGAHGEPPQSTQTEEPSDLWGTPGTRAN